MTITVIGHLCYDELHSSGKAGTNGAPEEQLGGIFYSLATLAALMSPNDIIHPVFGVGEADHDSLRKKLEEFPNVDGTGIYKVKGKTNRVIIFDAEESEHRIECSKFISEPIPFSKIKPHLDSDGILINMVSGFDITLETLDQIRMTIRESHTPIHFDFHSLTLGIDQEFKRFRRPLTDWRRWCFMLNSIQMTEAEASGISAERFDETTLINHLMPLMVNVLLITRGERGVTAILQNNKKLTKREIPGAPQGAVLDTTGCGDVFGASFLDHSLREKDYGKAAELANQAAGMKSSFRGTDGLRLLAQTSKA